MSTGVAPLVLASDLPGRPVVAIDCGDDVAEIKDVVFDPISHRLIGFTLNKRGWFRGTLKANLPRESISAIGPVAVMVESSSSLVADAESPESAEVADAAISVIGTRVLSAAGDELGEISDVVIETGPAPAATGYRITTADGDAYVPISAQVALSGENLVLPESATGFIRNDLAGFGAAVSDYRKTLETS